MPGEEAVSSTPAPGRFVRQGADCIRRVVVGAARNHRGRAGVSCGQERRLTHRRTAVCTR
ncbi:hypothetical protein SAM23877_6914 [Streptomyces ambofaciens ATCC 23877]|uniref:Uncharacterized protein n=1 Tax=Streptomyces ambofaciens (strain ATCC 23877 / 3486 / DSM 40053 / JCM 4204 / NBRC 12836 / NRRL B-2516) TaxID=278992 RepID=A0A0K2B3V6_STRA7|nr:hypothetical protein SAM23877_6914 [Streptomyces ambofaciens ATCC 23877]